MGNDFNKQNNLDIKRKQITLLVHAHYRKNVFLHKFSEKELVDMVLSKLLNTDLSIDEISEQILETIFQLIEQKKVSEIEILDLYDDENDKYSEGDKFDLLNQKFLSLIDVLNKEGIHYRISGISSGYLMYGDFPENSKNGIINILVDEGDFFKFKLVCQRLDLNFVDNRMCTNKRFEGDEIIGDSEIIATDSDNILKINIQEFQKLGKGRIAIKEYYFDRRKHLSVRQEVLSDSLSKIVFDNNNVSYQGRTIPVVAPEYDYVVNKSRNSQSEDTYIEFLKTNVDFDKVSDIRRLPNNGYAIIYSVVNDNKDYNSHNNSSSDNEINEIFDSLESYTSTTDSVYQEKKSKQLIRMYNSPFSTSFVKNSYAPTGYTNWFIVVLIILVIIFLFILGFIFLKVF